MRLHTSKSKNSESFYVSKGYVNDRGVSTSVIVRKLGTLAELLPEHGPTRDEVVVWCKEQCEIETQKYKEEQQAKAVQITFHADRSLGYHQQKFFRGGYLFLQSLYYGLQLNKTCRKLKSKYKFEYDINAILSDLIYARVLEPSSKRSSYKVAFDFLEKPSYALHDV
ncbi:MAG: transposase, partial [Oscillospiraceae bacterium]